MMCLFTVLIYSFVKYFSGVFAAALPPSLLPKGLVILGVRQVVVILQMTDICTSQGTCFSSRFFHFLYAIFL